MQVPQVMSNHGGRCLSLADNIYEMIEDSKVATESWDCFSRCFSGLQSSGFKILLPSDCLFQKQWNVGSWSYNSVPDTELSMTSSSVICGEQSLKTWVGG